MVEQSAYSNEKRGGNRCYIEGEFNASLNDVFYIPRYSPEKTSLKVSVHDADLAFHVTTSQAFISLR